MSGTRDRRVRRTRSETERALRDRGATVAYRVSGRWSLAFGCELAPAGGCDRAPFPPPSAIHIRSWSPTNPLAHREAADSPERQ